MKEILDNKVIVLPLFAWFLAQSIKFVSHFIKHGKFDFRKFVSSGGMPSSHSAISVCLATVLGIQYGFDSGIFALSVIFAFIVMADAAGVRRAAGKQAEVINKLIYSTDVKVEKELKVLLGHTPIQVFLGAALGILVGIVFAK
ncbi:MAG: divergent PAP2 family protein [Clostridiaceae bacterium]|nr:divergent PAP2 family protein [Clostridiaceae bacterium]